MSKNNNRLNTTNKIINELIERSKGSEEKQKELNDYGEKMEKGNRNEEKYDWVEDTIELDTR